MSSVKSALNAPAPVLSDGVEIIRMRYLEWQKEVRRAIQHEFAKIIWLPTAARAGKDRMSAMLVAELSIDLCLKRNNYELENGSLGLVPLVNVWVVAPTRALFKQCWSELLDYIPKSLIVEYRREEFIGLRGGISISFKSADHPEKLVSEGVDILWVTEASRIRSELVWFESLIPRLASPGRLGVALINGSPRNGKRHWYRRGCDNAERLIREAKIESSSTGKPVWSRERVWQLPMSVNPLMIDKLPMLRESMPKRLFDSECLGLWPDDEEKPFRTSDVDSLLVDGGGKAPAGPFKISIDVARTKNFTFACRWAAGIPGEDGSPGRPQIVDAMGLREMRSHQQVLKLVQFIKKGPGEVMVDKTGAFGMTMQESLERELGSKVLGYDFHGSKKEALVEGLILAVEQGSFEIRTDLVDEKWVKEIVDEFEAFECEIRDNGTVDYHGEPDDAIMSMGIGWYQCQHGFSVSNFDWQDYLGAIF